MKGQGLMISKRLPYFYTEFLIPFPNIETVMVANKKTKEILKEGMVMIVGGVVDPSQPPSPENVFDVGVLAIIEKMEEEESKMNVHIRMTNRIRSFGRQVGADEIMTTNWKILNETKPSHVEARSEKFQLKLKKIFIYLMRAVESLNGLININPLVECLNEAGSIEMIDQESAGIIIDHMAFALNHMPAKPLIREPLQDILSELDIPKRTDLLLKLAAGFFSGQKQLELLIHSDDDEVLENHPEITSGKNSKSNSYEKRYQEIKDRIPKEAQEEIEQELGRLKTGGSHSSELGMIKTHLDWLLGMPWDIYTKDTENLTAAQKILDEDHSDLEKVKERILEHLAVYQEKGNGNTTILCFVGPPGVGKTSLGKSIARAMGRNFVRWSIGGLRDESEIKGHKGTYINAMPGQIIESIKRAKSANPVFMLDEVDKISKDWRGDPASALLAVLDPEQNKDFKDTYLNVSFDLSRVFFICTANTLATIPEPLKDRMEIIELPGYTLKQKTEIAKQHLIEKQRASNGFPLKISDSSLDISFDDTALVGLIESYAYYETGVRELERQIGRIYRRIAKMARLGELVIDKPQIEITAENLLKFLGKPKFRSQQKFENMPPGCVPMFAVSHEHNVGHFFYVETKIDTHRDQSKIIVTGSRGSGESKEQINNLIEESVKIARDALLFEGGILEDFKKTNPGEYYLHVNIRDGAAPKDGPSAGIPILWAIYGLLTKQSVKPNLGATGEIGMVLGEVGAIGGIQGKLLAAIKAGIKTFLVPEENKDDLDEIPQEIKDVIEIKTVKTVWDALLEAFPGDERIIKYISSQNNLK